MNLVKCSKDKLHSNNWSADIVIYKVYVYSPID